MVLVMVVMVVMVVDDRGSGRDGSTVGGNDNCS